MSDLAATLAIVQTHLSLQRLRERRDAATRAWNVSSGTVLIAGGVPVPIAGTDQFHDFHAHPELRYLAGVAAPGSILAFDPQDGWSLFVHIADLEERVWSGDGPGLEDARLTSGIDPVLPLEKFEGWLETRRAEPLALLGNDDIRHRTAEYGIQHLAALELEFDDVLGARLSQQLSELRRSKHPDEIEAMRAAVAASRAGHLAAMRLAREGMTERELQIELETEFFRNGSLRTAYGSIVGTGPNGAVLHFAPTNRRLADGDVVLIDAAAEVDGYAADITRTFPVFETFSGVQRDIYQLVLETQLAAISAARPGVEYKDLHMAAALQISTGLRDIGILRGEPQDLVERDVHALFFPHGLGHMLGLATHDAGGCLAGRSRSERFGLKYLRADLPLQPGYVVTIEPGIYFIPALLDDPERRKELAGDVNWGAVDRLRGFGGIRIEDDVLITDSGAEVLSAAIPKGIAEIESIRAEAT